MQKWPNNLYLIRHGQSKRNVMKAAAKAAGKNPDYSEGIRDQNTPLTPRGRMQALTIGVELMSRCPEFLPDTIFVSPYLRTRQTCEEILKGLQYWPKVVVEERIREIEFGILDGLTPEGMKAKYPEEIARKKKEGKYYYRAPGGENRPDVNLRVHSFIDTLVRDYQEKNVAVICHSVVVMCFCHLFERWEEDQYLKVDAEDDIKNASLTHYSCIDNKMRQQGFNQIFYQEETNE